MKINVETGDITKSDAKAIIVNLFQGVTSPGGATGAVDKALGGGISALIAKARSRARRARSSLVHSLGKMPSPRVLVAGLGKQETFDLNVIRDLMGTALRRARATGAKTVATILHGAGIAGLDPEACAQAIAEGADLGAYRFRKYKDDSVTAETPATSTTLTIVESDASKRGRDQARRRARPDHGAGRQHTRDLANEPANALCPVSALAERARRWPRTPASTASPRRRADPEAGHGRADGRRLRLGAAAALHRHPLQGRPESKKTLGLLGKGITFDSGGISIKPAAGMEAMKGDMSGAAAVICAIWAIGKLKPKINVTCLVPTAENMPSGSATRPGDVVRAMNGKTIEVINTDAEGRLILADAICYARQEKLSPIIDVATLTGAMMIALGPGATGFFATDDDARGTTSTSAGETSGEKMWRFPLIDEYREGLKSNVADIKNTGPRNGGAINAAKFLHFFVGRHRVGAHRHGRHRRVRQGEGRLGEGLDRHPDAHADQLRPRPRRELTRWRGCSALSRFPQCGVDA